MIQAQQIAAAQVGLGSLARDITEHATAAESMLHRALGEVRFTQQGELASSLRRFGNGTVKGALTVQVPLDAYPLLAGARAHAGAARSGLTSYRNVVERLGAIDEGRFAGIVGAIDDAWSSVGQLDSTATRYADLTNMSARLEPLERGTWRVADDPVLEWTAHVSKDGRVRRTFEAWDGAFGDSIASPGFAPQVGMRSKLFESAHAWETRTELTAVPTGRIDITRLPRLDHAALARLADPA